MKYPIGIQSFEQIVEGGYLYMDKTKLVYDLVHNSTMCFLGRPRRFGKSLLVSTLECYFRGRKDLFKGLALEGLETEWKTYPVFHIDFNGQNFTKSGELEAALLEFVERKELIYGRDPLAVTLGSRFRAVLRRAHEQTGLRVVVLVDEYDKPLLDVLDMDLCAEVDGERRLLEDWHRQVLKGFYGVFKAAAEDLRFVFLTGVTKFSQVSVFSDLNQLDDISMDERYEAICGITEEELQDVLGGPVRDMAVKCRLTEEEMRKRLKRKYDGYHFSQAMLDVYNPFSILNALSKQQLADFWFRTGSPTYLVRLLALGNENLNELTGKYYSTGAFIDYKADVQSPLPMIYQSGYLTIKDYDFETDSYLLDFPNDEVKNGFVTMVAAHYLKSSTDAGAWILEVVKAMKMGNLAQLKRLFTSFLASIPYSQRRRESEREKERYFQYTFYLIMRMISSYLVMVEKEQSEGRADCIIETSSDVYVFEFKLDGTAEEALQQIEKKGYAREYGADGRHIHKIGCSFSSATGTIAEWMVR